MKLFPYKEWWLVTFRLRRLYIIIIIFVIIFSSSYRKIFVKIRNNSEMPCTNIFHNSHLERYSILHSFVFWILPLVSPSLSSHCFYKTFCKNICVLYYEYLPQKNSICICIWKYLSKCCSLIYIWNISEISCVLYFEYCLLFCLI